MPAPDETRNSLRPVERVRLELRRYEHPLLDFSAQEKDDGAVELVIELRNAPPEAHVYRAALHPRDLSGGQFEWSFQRMLYDCLHDFMVELFVRTPQSRDGAP